MLIAALAWCAPVRAQIARVNETGTTNSSSASNITAPAISITGGNLIVVGTSLSSTAVSVSSVTDTALNTFVQGTSCLVSTSSERIDIWYAKNVTGNASDAVKVNYSGAVGFQSVSVVQYSGADATSPFEVCAIGSGLSGTTLTSASFSPAASTNMNYAFAHGPGSSPTFTAGTNYSMIRTNAFFGAEERLSVPSGAQTATETIGVSAAWQISVASFKAAAAAATGGGSDKRRRYEQADAE